MIHEFDDGHTGSAQRAALSLSQGFYTRLIAPIGLLLQFIVTATMAKILGKCFKNENNSF